MKNPKLKPLTPKKLPKNDREAAVLLGLVDLYIKTGRPIGSQTLQENGFDSLSSATIRNYFSKMEEEGFLKQPHTSGGRLPTGKAFRLYYNALQGKGEVTKTQEALFEEVISKESRQIPELLRQAVERLSELTQCAAFISSPRFDQDFVQQIRLIQLDPQKLLSILITDFGLIRTETLYVEHPVDPLFLRTAEEYFRWRMNQGEKPLFRDEKETKLAQRLYNEVMVRHVVGYANFPTEDIVRTGFSKLLAYPEFNDAAALGQSLSLLEDEAEMRPLLRETVKKNGPLAWIGEELSPHVPESSDCAILAIPYRIHQVPAGAVALLGPMRLPYRNLLGLLQLFSEQVSEIVTQNIYKFKISYRQPPQPAGSDSKIASPESILLEDQSRNLS